MSEEVRTVSIPASKVFVDFGRRKVYAITSDGDEVLVFNSLEEMVSALKPATIVIDNLPNKLLKTAAEISNAGVTILRLKDLRKIAETRRRYGMKKTDEDDVRILKTIYQQHPEEFQPLIPEALEVQALTELWVELNEQKMKAKYARTTTGNPVAMEIHRTLRRLIEKLSEEIHEKALKLPLYRRVTQQLGLKGPSLAYILSHDATALATLSLDELMIRYGLVDCYPQYRRTLRSRLLILLANIAVRHGHPRYRAIYEEYRRRKGRHWSSVLRVAKRLLKDLRRLAKTQDAGPG